MSFMDAVNVIRLYQENFQFPNFISALHDMLARDRTELFGLEHQALKVMSQVDPYYYKDL